jgi:YD repeat-containing protein
VGICHKSYSQLQSNQPSNPDASQNYVTVNLPRTPESAGFEKYGNPEVNEFTGTTNVSIPIYTLKSRFLEAPITLSYQATGIRVNQEASWVGLGWDLNTGGRVTRETRGDVDFQSASYYSATTLAAGMQQIFSRLGGGRENAVLTLATIATCDINGSCTSSPDANFYSAQAVSDMTQYGVGEPDIFRANFFGHSLTFYYDKSSASNPIRFIGEKSSFLISNTWTSHNDIATFTITDNDGNQYQFYQTETLINSIPANATVPSSSTSAWLLTKVVHPSGDYIQFSYNNYGYSVPAFSMGTALNWQAVSTANLPSDNNQNVVVHSPYYLTKMETSDVSVDFTLDMRADLYGAGSKRLTQITVTDKLSSTVKKTVSFSYGYFQSTFKPWSTYLSNLGYGLPGLPNNSIDNLVDATYINNYSSTRLRLESVSLNNSSYETPYTFYYNSITPPDKYDYGQDHWGYYNGVGNTNGGAYRFTHLIPYSSLGQNLATSVVNGVGGSNLGVSRECDGTLMQTMMLNKVVYPTGGSSVFTYEPHVSTMVPTTSVTGGGLRVKAISNYSQGNLVDSTTYSYSGGKYMGTIQYFSTANELANCAGTSPWNGGYYKLSSNGAVNHNDILLGYAQVTTKRFSSKGTQNNGSIVKNFNINTPQGGYANGVGYDADAPYFPPAELLISNCSQPTGGPLYSQQWYTWLDPAHKALPPTPSSNLEGKLMLEQYYDNSNTLVKSVNYYYHLAAYTNSFYDVRAIQNRQGGFSSCPTGSMDDGFGTCGNRPVILYVSPAKAFYTLLDSVVESEFANGIAFTTKKYSTYDVPRYQLKTQQVFNSDGTSSTTTFTRPYDYTSGSGYPPGQGTPTWLLQMVNSYNIINPIFTTTTTRNGQPVNTVNNIFYNPSSGVYVPQYTQVQIASNPIETRMLYNSYDSFGHLQEAQKPSGQKEAYVWGYDNRFPVAHIIGTDYQTVSGMVNASIVNNPSSDDALRTELNKLRTQLSGVQVTTYSYDPVVGMTSATDPNNITTYYYYDAIGRLSYIKDANNNIVKEFEYHYKH